MRVFRKAFAAIVPVVVSGCIFMGPRDGVVVITGNAPSTEGSRCTVAVGPNGGRERPSEREVVGQFKETFVVHPNRRGHHASLQCGGGVGVISKRTFRYGRDVDIGGEIPLDGHAP
jgi:hypothetical protein